MLSHEAPGTHGPPRSVPGPIARRWPGARVAALAAIVSIFAAGPVRSADPSDATDQSDPGVRARIEAELGRQQEMLGRLQRGEALGEGDLEDVEAAPEPELGDRADPRRAPEAPVDRSLPVAIFDETRVEIERGTWGNRSDLELLQRVLDADRDGHPELVRFVDPESGRMVRQEEDRNYDGLLDAWSDYVDGALVARTLDANDDGHPDTWERYADGRMTSREIDRDDDGVRDAFYRYDDGLLAEERHDADNDGAIDLRVTYVDGRRERSEEDRDRDGRIDTWRSYRVVGDREIVERIERDAKGRGYADTFEVYEPVDGRAVLVRRDEDMDGDGEIDVSSFYENGKLVRREILSPDLSPL